MAPLPLCLAEARQLLFGWHPVGTLLGGFVLVVFQDQVASTVECQGSPTLEEQPAKRILDVIDEGLILIEPDGQITYANPAAERILGFRESEIQSRSYVSPDWQVVRLDGTPMPPDEMAGPRAMATRRTVRNVVMGVRRGDGELSWLSVNASPLFSSSGEFEGVAGAFTDITPRVRAEKRLIKQTEELEELVKERSRDLLEANRRLEEAVRTDSLTGVANRRGFFERGELLIGLAARQRQALTVAYLDVDNLKWVNDTLGHDEGDQVLVVVGRVLSGTMRSSDAVGRLGGDEFGAVAVGAPIERSEALFGRLHSELLETMRTRGWKTGVSIGVTVFTQDPPDLEKALKAADALMYRAKKGDGDRVVCVELDNADLAGVSAATSARPERGH